MVNVREIFHSIQGEGHNVGTPMVFIRLAGCNLRCPFCDTKDSWNPESGKPMSVEEILSVLRGYTCRWVCITGGEPTTQDLSELIRRLREDGYKVALETNGTIFQKSLRLVSWLTVSPKPGADVHPLVLEMADELKYVICSESDLQRVKPHDRVYLQPVDNNPKAIEICLNAIMSDPGLSLSLQIHKLIGIK